MQLCPKSSLNDANELTSKENTSSDISYILDEAETMTNFSYDIKETKSTSPDNLAITGDEISNKVDSDMKSRHVVELSAKEFQKSKEEIRRHQRRLLKNLDDLSLEITKKGDIERDGNCFFRAVSYQLEIYLKIAVSPKELRFRVYQELCKNYKDYIVFTTLGHEEKDKYLNEIQDIKTDGKWNFEFFELVVPAIANIFEIQIVIVTSDEKNTAVTVQPVQHPKLMRSST